MKKNKKPEYWLEKPGFSIWANVVSPIVLPGVAGFIRGQYDCIDAGTVSGALLVAPFIISNYVNVKDLRDYQHSVYCEIVRDKRQGVVRSQLVNKLDRTPEEADKIMGGIEEATKWGSFLESNIARRNRGIIFLGGVSYAMGVFLGGLTK